MPNRFKFSQASIDALPAAAPGTRDRYYDLDVRGLTLRVGPAGDKIFYFLMKVAGRTVQSKVGPYPTVTLDMARKKVMQARIAAEEKADPVKAIGRQRLEMTVRELFDWWLEQHAKTRRKTWEECEKNFKRYLTPLANKPLSLVSKADVRMLHAKVARDIAAETAAANEAGNTNKRRGNGYSTANRVFEMLRTVYNQAIKADLYEGNNPTLGIDWFPEHSRERRLMAEEVTAFMDAVDKEKNTDIRDYVLMSLFTGQRQGNVLAMRWEDLDLEGRSWLIPETKNGRPHTVFLEDQEIDLLRARLGGATGPWVFPGRTRGGRPSSTGHMMKPKRGWQRILDAAGIADLRRHDLRRTLGSWMVDTGAPLEVIGKALNHQSPAATAIYARLSPKPVRAAKVKALDALQQARKGPSTQA